MPSDDDRTPYQGAPRPSRRTVLRGAGTVAALGAGAGLASQVGLGPVEPWSPAPDTWPLTDYDPGATAHSPGTAPPSDPAVDWVDDSLRRAADTDVTLVVGTEAVYAAHRETVALARADGTERWREETSGAALALVDGTLFVGPRAHVPPGVDPLRALDAADGTERWSLSVADRLTALVPAEGMLFAGGETGVYAVTPGGRRKWTDGDDFAERVLLTGGRLHAVADGLRAYDRRTLLDVPLGSSPRLAWETGGFVTDTAGSDAGLAVGFGRHFDEATEPGLAVVAPGSGTARWTALDDPAAGSPSAVATGAIRCFAGLVADDPPLAVAAYRLGDGTRDWRVPLDRRVTNLAVAGATVLVGTAGDDGTSGTVRALSSTDGSERWRVPLDAGVTSLAPVDEAVFVALADGRVLAVR